MIRYNTVMKRILVLLFVGAVFLAWTRTRSTSERMVPNPSPSPLELPAPQVSPTAEVVLNGISYAVYAQSLRDRPVELFANFSDHESGAALVRRHGCQAAINGGFYREDGKPLGLFITEGETYGPAISSTLVNGFFWKSESGEYHIGKTQPPLESTAFILQSGPYMSVGNYRLQLIADEEARRSLIGIDQDGSLSLVSVAQKDNTFSGPLLADVPMLFADPAVQKILPLQMLLNLDGGTASFFYKKTGDQIIVFSELKPIGSLLCIK